MKGDFADLIDRERKRVIGAAMERSATLQAAADELGIARYTLARWSAKLGIVVTPTEWRARRKARKEVIKRMLR